MFARCLAYEKQEKAGASKVVAREGEDASRRRWRGGLPDAGNSWTDIAGSSVQGGQCLYDVDDM